ncbi:MAG: flippase [Candidatus Aceula meridiana]|nr:flippase [Candidatus Aceula meridiana]
MIKNIIHTLTRTHERRRLLENFFSLSFLQAASYILPLITLPYLVRVLGVEKFGLIAFAQAFIQYFVVLTDYGFDLSATREVSIHRGNKEKLSVIVSSVFVIKSLFLIISMVILAVVLLMVPKFRMDWLIYVFSFGIVFDNVLFPVWFFQGIENMKYITIRNVVAKLVFTLLIFVFIREQSDYLKVPLINSLGMIVSGIIGAIPVFFSFGLSFRRPRLEDIRRQLGSGWHIFVSRLAISLYTTTNTVVLGLFLNNTVVGYYAAGDRIVRMLTRMLEPGFRAAYPYITKKVAESQQLAIQTLRKVFKISFLISIFIFIVFLTCSSAIVRIVLGAQFSESLIIVRILSLLLVIIPASYIFANLGLLSFRLDKHFLGIYLSGGLINVVFLFLFLGVFHLGGVGAAWSSVLTELVLMICMWKVLKRRKINFIL